MKYIIIVIVALLLLAVGVFLGLFAANSNRWFADQCYVRVGSEYAELDRAEFGDWRFQYRLSCYSENGAQTQLAFLAPKALRDGALLRLYVKGGEVTAWEEVRPDLVPPSVRPALR
ncbi:YxeA family protein [Nitratireductor luteus]|uniref:YxeA family protein n=1 Tax=Nitratireductor luteus TaxID=2976980 RepID=UPI00223F9EC2|nr:YxeA family protein [Nitratireductor luteus]